ncbi:MAG: hypothetical protein A2Z20_10800 [Bdellovibrionales bacterium RBG_16_40_8]|nr:MAG: hypothetical protein A2Z20_10800 [Bdellovibrionales bacterium RBG_16_40_8]
MTIDIKTHKTADDVIIELSNDLSETMSLPNIKPLLSQRVIFECENIKYINSEAVQLWAHWLSKLDERIQIVFRKTPPRVVDYFNIIDGFLPTSATVESFFVPYECEKCEHVELYLAQRGKDYIDSSAGEAVQINLPKIINCPGCQGAMELGIWKEKYLKFLIVKSGSGVTT